MPARQRMNILSGCVRMICDVTTGYESRNKSHDDDNIDWLINKLYLSGYNTPTGCCVYLRFFFLCRCALVNIPQKYSYEIDSYWNLQVANKLSQLLSEE